MYTILIGNDNSLTTTCRERIMQRSKLVDNLCFLAYPIYKEQNMAEYTVLLEYVLPCSRKYRTEILELSNEMYEDHLKYLLPFDTQLTSEAGEIEAQITFAKADIDDKGNSIQRVRKTSTVKITIVPISAWSDIIPDSALSAIDQRIIKVDAQIKALDEMGEILHNSKADNLSYENNKLQLLANGKKIGKAVTIKAAAENEPEENEPDKPTNPDEPDVPNEPDEPVEPDDPEDPENPEVDNVIEF